MKKVKDLKTYYFDCDCSSPEHTFGLAFDVENKEIMILTQLSTRAGLFKRVWNALLYVFNAQTPYGQWEETVLNEDKFNQLYNIMTRFKHTAGIKDKSARKIQTALDEINKGKSNSILNETHKLGDITNTFKAKK